MGKSACMSVVALCLCLLAGSVLAANPAAGKDPGVFVSPYAKWQNGPPKDANYFPIATWLQPAKYGKQLQEAGVNLVIGIWNGPDEKALADFKALGMPVICAQNEVALKHKDDPIIVGWIYKDEPDNAQPVAGFWKNDEAAIRKAWPEANRTLAQWGTYGPPVPPKDIIAEYQKIVAADPTRPVYMNLGQGVAYNNYNGRGYRRYKSEDYPEYIKGCDIVSFDLYAYTFPNPEVKGKIWLVPFGVDNLRKWSGGRKVVWNFVETTQVYKDANKPPPGIVNAEVWMSIIHGSQGITYYAHGQGSDGGDSENALVSDKEMMAALKDINAQVKALAPVINSPTVEGGAVAQATAPDAVVDCIAKKHGGATYVFAVGMRPIKTAAKFTVKGLPDAKVEVIGEKRSLDAKAGAFEDTFGPYEVHLYKITNP